MIQTHDSNTSNNLFAIASLILSIITIVILVSGPKGQTPCPATPTLSVEQMLDPAYVFTDPAVAARRAAQQALTDRMCAKGYPGPGGKTDCAAAKKLRATISG